MAKIKYTVLYWIVLSLLIAYIVIFGLANANIFGISLFPNFVAIESQITYYLDIILFIVLQVAMIMIFYKLFTTIFRKILTFRQKLEKWSYSIQRYIVN